MRILFQKDEAVTIKSNKYGLLVFLDKTTPYEQLLDEIQNKFHESARFFKNATMAVTFQGRFLTANQEREIVQVISRASGIHITCIVDTNEEREATFKTLVEQSLKSVEKDDGLFYRGTLRRKQVLESESSIIIVGNVEFGASVVSKKNIVVLGALRGNAHAGASGDRSSFVSALKMRPNALKIADISYNCSRMKISETVKPQIAELDGDHIYIDSLVTYD